MVALACCSLVRMARVGHLRLLQRTARPLFTCMSCACSRLVVNALPSLVHVKNFTSQAR